MEARPIPYLKVTGSAYEMGWQHGNFLANKIRDISERSLDWIERSGSLSRKHVLERVHLYVPYVQSRTPWLIEEVQGIADGAGISFEEAFALQARFELVYTPAAECSVLGIAGSRSSNQKTIVAQNMDLSADQEDNIVVLHLVPNDGRPEILTVTISGILSQEGINSSGLALCGSLVVSRGWGKGFPNRNFLRRHILEQPDIPAALTVLKEVRERAASHHLMLGDGWGNLICLEQTPQTYRIVKPDCGIIAHTNHYQHPELVPFEALSSANPSLYRNSLARQKRLHELLSKHQGPISLDTVRVFLADHHGEHPICTHTGRESKTVAFIALQPEMRALYAGLGNPCRSGFNVYHFEN